MGNKMTDLEFMQRAIELAGKGSGSVSPNPVVGAVIVKDGKIIAEGYHKKFGGPHAEIEAINSASGTSLEGADIYVTLEPCSHYGKTPPCAGALIAKKFSRVFIGMTDPNPMVNGRGVEMLEKAGIEVRTGLLEEECRWLNRFFIKHITTGLPYVILKSAQSLNGAIATQSGESKWITGSESLRAAHQLRAEADAVLVGKNTALMDDPSLTVRNVSGRNPLRMILDTGLTLPMTLNVFTDEHRAKTIVCCSEAASLTEKATKLRDRGVKILAYDPAENGFGQLLKSAAVEHGITSILVEGGASVLSSFATGGYADEYHFFIAPVIIPGGMISYGGYPIDSLSEALKLEIRSVERSGADLHVTGVKAKS